MSLMYRQLLEHLKAMSEEELSCDVTALVTDAGEFVPVKALVYTDHTDVLDKGHPYLMV